MAEQDVPSVATTGGPGGAEVAALADRHLGPGVALLVFLGSVVLVSAGAAFGTLTAVLALVAVTYGVVMVRSPLFTGLMLIALVPVTAGLGRGLLVPGLKVTEVLIGVGAVLVLLLGLRETAARWGAVDWMAFAYVVGNAGLVIFNAVTLEHGATPEEAVAIVGSPLLFFLLYRTVATAIRTPDARAKALRCLLWASLPVSVLGLLQMVSAPVHDALVFVTDTGVFDRVGWEPLLRASSVFPIWHSLAAYLLVVVVLGTALLLDENQRVMTHAQLWVVLVPAAVALVLTLTIAALAGVVLGVGLVGTAYGKFRQVVMTLAAAGLAIVVLLWPLLAARIDEQLVRTSGGSTSLLPETIATRVAIWTEQYLPALAGNLLRGYGQDAPPGVIWEHTESQYLTFLLRGGVPLLLVVAALAVVVYVSARRWEADPERAPIARTVRATVVVFAIISLIFPYFTSNGMSHITWILWGLVFAPALSGGPGGPADPPAEPVSLSEDGPGAGESGVGSGHAVATARSGAHV